MKPLTIITICCLILSKCAISFSQDTINLLSGKQIVAKSIYEEPTNALLKYDILKNRLAGFQITWVNFDLEYYILKRKVIKQKAVDKINIFSINYFDKTDRILYRQDTAIGYDLSIPEMEYYILGERDAIKNYKAPAITVGGVVLGFGATYFAGFWGLLMPAVYGTTMGVIDPKIKLSESTKPEMRTNKDFVEGYMTTATRKKVKNAIMGSLVGATAFAIATILINARFH